MKIKDLQKILRKLISGIIANITPRREKFVGHIDFVTDIEIRGWACNKLDLSRPVYVEVLIDGEVIANLPADQYRDDLKLSGIGTGHHGFSFTLQKPARAGVALSARAKGTFFPCSMTHPNGIEPVHRSAIHFLVEFLLCRSVLRR
ncbi:hypothetical protein P6U16_08205 [Rhizobium sp. 32-5/1]|uniref:hypothetical protein n=1 Tax=Rhizobium sp. 32-5/1 TaxID=3019602 RepID=UPI00240DF22D|nr:hypothetical protein [Rhizobium sp. 32-5/1]WEZ84549.1 hypothetical protein P6U16_08205 [Rhizobium sp. 32-5/1]